MSVIPAMVRNMDVSRVVTVALDVHYDNDDYYDHNRPKQNAQARARKSTHAHQLRAYVYLLLDQFGVR